MSRARWHDQDRARPAGRLRMPAPRSRPGHGGERQRARPGSASHSVSRDDAASPRSRAAPPQACHPRSPREPDAGQDAERRAAATVARRTTADGIGSPAPPRTATWPGRPGSPSDGAEWPTRFREDHRVLEPRLWRKEEQGARDDGERAPPAPSVPHDSAANTAGSSVTGTTLRSATSPAPTPAATPPSATIVTPSATIVPTLPIPDR